ncbi:DUF5995 family protein [Chondromyces apiculatus]|uniref:Uncharacterized protein n=1 Tax=Chondromyces apiculatus DSM 436 TaxID=1192034 RepID=A0A017THI3_9BACT|nr:DUF5995 family protein [Chondromyces apiculatus]EYF08709.1 Hypothetical protein CAP_2570 [Chondromyces apiculatus DSM 436]
MRDNETYYFDFGHGKWIGTFDFEITGLTDLVRSGASLPDMVWATALHAACKIGKATINSAITGYPGSTLARSHAAIHLETLVLLPALRIYTLRGAYQLDPNGRDVQVDMIEAYGPLSMLFQRRTPATAVVTEGGRRAEYTLTMFGTPWKGVYAIDRPAGDQVDVAYASTWGKLTYQANRMGPPRPPSEDSVSGPVLELRQGAERLSSHTRQLRARRDLRAAFTEVYADTLFALSQVVERGLLRASVPTHPARRIRDAAWIARLSNLFLERYLSALDAHDQHRHVPRPWALVFDALERRTMTELDAVALSMFVHLTSDLPHALAAVRSEETDGPERALEDFELLNDVLASFIDDMQQAMSDRHGVLYGWLSLLGGGAADMVLGHQVRVLRTAAWYTSERLMARDPAIRADAEDRIVRDLERFMSALLDPRPWALRVAAHLARSALARRRLW